MPRKPRQVTARPLGVLQLEKVGFVEVVAQALALRTKGVPIFLRDGWLEGLRLVGPHDALAADLEPSLMIELTATDIIRKDWKLFLKPSYSQRKKAEAESEPDAAAAGAAGDAADFTPAPAVKPGARPRPDPKSSVEKSSEDEDNDAGYSDAESDHSDVDSDLEDPDPDSDSEDDDSSDRRGGTA